MQNLMLLAVERTIMFECETVPPSADRVLQYSFCIRCLLIHVICTKILVFDRYVRCPAVFHSLELFSVHKTALVLSSLIYVVPHDAVIGLVVDRSNGCVRVLYSGDQLVFLSIVVCDWVVRSRLYLW